MSGVILNGQEFTNVGFGKPLWSVDALGNPTKNRNPEVLGNKLYTEPYMRLSNALPLSCPDKWSVGVDDIPAANDGNIKFGKSVATGLPICRKGKDVCFPGEIGLMGQNMFVDRGNFKKCDDSADGVSYLMGKKFGRIGNLEDAKKVCDSDKECQGFVSSNGKIGVNYRFVRSGLESGNPIKNMQDMRDVGIVGGTKFTTYIKNTAGSKYTPYPVGSMLGVTKQELGLNEHFIGGCAIRKNLGLLLVVLIIVGLLFFMRR